jgi:hypothetical protein
MSEAAAGTDADADAAAAQGRDERGMVEITIEELADRLETRLTASMAETIRHELEDRLTGPLAFVVRLADELGGALVRLAEVGTKTQERTAALADVIADVRLATMDLQQALTAPIDEATLTRILQEEHQTLVDEIVGPLMDGLVQLAEHVEAVQAAVAWTVVDRLDR